jgi:hypothetical protein
MKTANHDNVDTTKQEGNETTLLQKMHHLLQKEMNHTGFWNCTRAEKTHLLKREKKRKRKKTCRFIKGGADQRSS